MLAALPANRQWIQQGRKRPRLPGQMLNAERRFRGGPKPARQSPGPARRSRPAGCDGAGRREVLPPARVRGTVSAPWVLRECPVGVP